MYMENWRLFGIGLYVLFTAYVMIKQIETIDKLTDRITQIEKGETNNGRKESY